MAAKTLALPAPLALAKTDWPKNAVAKTAMTAAGGSIMRAAKTIKTIAALREFWSGLQIYCTRNVAELNGITGGETAAAAAPAKPRGRPAAAAAGGETPPKRPHRKTAGVSA